MGDTAQIKFDPIPSFLGVHVGDLEELVPGQVAFAGYFVTISTDQRRDSATSQDSCDMPHNQGMHLQMLLIWGTLTYFRLSRTSIFLQLSRNARRSWKPVRGCCWLVAIPVA